MISILNYQQYREFLKDFYEDQKSRKTGFTYARFSAAVGLNSQNYYKLVMDGQKNLTSENIIRFAKGLKLSEVEADYFEALVNFNQGGKRLEREYYFDRMKRIRQRADKVASDERTLEQDEFEVISNWICNAVIVLTHVRGFRESPHWIRERMYRLASEEEIASVLERLIALGLIARDGSGRLRQTSKTIRTQPELRKISAKFFYEGLLKRGIQALDLTEPKDREFGAYLVGLSRKQIPELKKRVREFLRSLNDWALENSDPEQVYAMAFTGFPLTSAEASTPRRTK